jgi:hypothetical protein
MLISTFVFYRASWSSTLASNLLAIVMKLLVCINILVLVIGLSVGLFVEIGHTNGFDISLDIWLG